ncbi:hypothetical protein [Longimicrobium sp.]|uniref:hypothetical protein n=1 Tax=Longimicrobium sp. TaxID=2029185 RepID=UPI003B3A3D9B
MIRETLSFPAALGIWAWATLEMAGLLVACGLIIAVPLGVVFGIMFALSKLAGRMCRLRVPRDGEGG